MPKIPKLFKSRNIVTTILYFITLALAINFIMNRQIMALLSLVIIAGFVYYIIKNVTISLIVSIIVTNLLLATNNLEMPYIEPLLQTRKTGQVITSEMYV